MKQFEGCIEDGTIAEVFYLTYDPNDRTAVQELHQSGQLNPKISILAPPRLLRSRFGNVIYSVIAPFIHYRVIRRANILRSQQVSGAWTGLIAKFVARRPFLFRAGYPLSVRFQSEGKPIKRWVTLIIEWGLVRLANQVAVSSRAMQSYYASSGGGDKITLLPSYVDLSAFSPISDYSADKPILFVGRLEPVKNIESLIEACAALGMTLHIYGHGSLESALKEKASRLGAEVAFKGTVPNADLAKIHHNHSVYVLCSTREGMPKSLIEAMASGLLCISTPTEGGKEMIKDGTTGYLTEGFDSASIAESLKRALSALEASVGAAASEYVRTHNSLEYSNQVEKSIWRRMLSGGERLPQEAMEQ